MFVQVVIFLTMMYFNNDFDTERRVSGRLSVQLNLAKTANPIKVTKCIRQDLTLSMINESKKLVNESKLVERVSGLL